LRAAAYHELVLIGPELRILMSPCAVHAPPPVRVVPGGQATVAELVLPTPTFTIRCSSTTLNKIIGATGTHADPSKRIY